MQTTPQPPVGLIVDPKAALSYITGGAAEFGLVSARTGQRLDYKISRGVSTLLVRYGVADNYIGYLRATKSGPVLHSGRNGDAQDPAFKALKWLLGALKSGHMPTTVELWHNGRCSRCKRRLTDPESIARGLGPECAAKLGV
jgi:hypothetical protein